MDGTAFDHECPICGDPMELLTQTKPIHGRPSLRRSGIYKCTGCAGEWQLTVMLEPSQASTSRRWSMALKAAGVVA